MLYVIVKLCVKFFYKYNIENNSNKKKVNKEIGCHNLGFGPYFKV